MLDEIAMRFLSDEEQVIHSGKASHLVAEPGPGTTTTDVWKTGHLYLITQRLVWCYEFDGKVALEVPLDKIAEVKVARRDPGGMPKNKTALGLACWNGAGDEVACFSDGFQELNEWQKMTSEVMAGHYMGVDAEDDMEECSRCGRLLICDPERSEGSLDSSLRSE